MACVSLCAVVLPHTDSACVCLRWDGVLLTRGGPPLVRPHPTALDLRLVTHTTAWVAQRMPTTLRRYPHATLGTAGAVLSLPLWCARSWPSGGLGIVFVVPVVSHVLGVAGISGMNPAC